MPEISPSKYRVDCGWDHVPHLDEDTKRELLASTMPYMRDARSKGIPSLGSGAVYPIAESEITCKPFAIPAYWPRAYALDVGWKKTAALWGAWDETTDTLYAYTEHYRGEAEPSVHAAAIRARGEWIPGVVDPASRGRSQRDGEMLFASYRDLGLNLTLANNKVTGEDGGIFKVWERLTTGRLKIFETCQNLLEEYRNYQRDKNGKIVKENDHLMDCCRYLCASGREIAIVKPVVRSAAAVTPVGDAVINY
jgi:hypothetical protein